MISCDFLCATSCLRSFTYWVLLKTEQNKIRDLFSKHLDGARISRTACQAIENSMEFYVLEHKESKNLMNLCLFTAINMKIWSVVIKILSHSQKDKLSLGNIVFTLSEAIIHERKDVVSEIIQNHAKKIRSRDMRRALLFLYPNLIQASVAQEAAFNSHILEQKRQRIAKIASGIFE